MKTFLIAIAAILTAIVIRADGIPGQFSINNPTNYSHTVYTAADTNTSPVIVAARTNSTREVLFISNCGTPDVYVTLSSNAVAGTGYLLRSNSPPFILQAPIIYNGAVSARTANTQTGSVCIIEGAPQ